MTLAHLSLGLSALAFAIFGTWLLVSPTPLGRIGFLEGDPGDACFILVAGQVEVTIKIRQQRHLLAQLSPGAIFGHVSLISGVPRSATCTIRRDAVLAQLDRAACERLLGTRALVALKFLAALHRGLTEALRVADRRLMRLDEGPRLTTATTHAD